MKLAIAGKGGSGKTSISGTLAQMLARQMNSLTTLTGDMLDRSNGDLPAVEAIEQLADTVAAA